MLDRSIALLLAAAAVGAPAWAAAPSSALIAAVHAPTRTEADLARDRDRHPAETLAFFGVKPADHVVELWPFGGWYTAILAPYLAAGGGTLTVASPPGKYADQINRKLESDAATYGKVRRASFPALLGGSPTVPAGSADAVLTFRNVHNWRMGMGAPDKQDYAAHAFREIFAMLKPGGVLGIEEHRMPEEMAAANEMSSGYMKVSTIRRLAEQAGFRFVGASEINANPRDTHDYPQGVWTLPPTYAEADKDRGRYAAIGESDRMTLKFVKPR